MSTRHKSARRRPHETRARDDDDQMLARWCYTGPLNVRGIVAYEPLRTTVRAPALMSHELCNLMCGQMYSKLSRASQGLLEHVPREKETRKYQSTAVDDEEDDENGDDNDDDGDGQTTSMACRTREDGDWMAPLWFASLAS